MSIVWTSSARQDVNGIWDFMEEHHPDAAELVDSKILKAVSSLAQFPKRGKPGRVKGTRELRVPNSAYVVVYLVMESEIVILRVLHSAQNWPPDT
jgi:toxin ParE1/3/4